MKLFISADIEGTAGIVSWKETAPGDQYGYFAGQRSIKAYRASFYPGAVKAGAKAVAYEADDYMDVLRFVMFCM